jgi:hypothetical protein
MKLWVLAITDIDGDDTRVSYSIYGTEEAAESAVRTRTFFRKGLSSVPVRLNVFEADAHESVFPTPKPQPIPMRLFCPACNHLHIDDEEFATKPHHTHACQNCGNVWRPAIVNTVGVQFLPGFKNE